jgi:His Kinase A (phospho-acceptor) domain
MQPSPSSPNRIHPGLTGNTAQLGQLGIGTPVLQVCPLCLPKTIPPFLLRELGHELKTPLTGLLGLAQLFRAEIKPNTQRQSQCASLIYQKAQQLLIAIYDLMDLSQLACHQFNLNVQSLDLSQLIQSAWQATTSQYDEGYLKITPDFQTEVGQVIADVVRLKQLFIHLISHFLLQLPKDSSLSIRSFSWGDWLMIQCHTPSYWLPESQQALFNQHHGPEDLASQTFSDVSNIFKLLLVSYLAQLQGGTAFLLSEEPLGLDYTVLLPQDITTPFIRSDEPLTLILLSSRPQVAQLLYPICKKENVLFLVVRSSAELPQHLHLLRRMGVVIDGQWGENWTEMQTLLEAIPGSIRQIAVLGEPLSEIKSLASIQCWPENVTPAQIRRTLRRWQVETSTPAPLPPPSLQSHAVVPQLTPQALELPLTLLQIDAPLPDSTPFNDLFNQLANLHRCSIVTADHVEQAELLFRVWSPHIVVCTTVLSPEEIRHLVASELAVSPIVFVDYDAQTTARLEQTPLKTYFYTSNPETLTLKQQVEQLYQFLREIRINS